MSKSAATDFDNSHTRMSNIEDGDKGSGPVSGPVLFDSTNDASTAISTMTVAALKAELDRAKICYIDSSLATFIIAEAKRRDE